MASDKGILRLEVNRAGLVDEVLAFLNDLQSAYEHLYALNLKIDEAWQKHQTEESFTYGYRKRRPPALPHTRNVREVVVPNDRLIIDKVVIESPGAWEFLASLNPLQQIREYLKDRHERKRIRGGVKNKKKKRWSKKPPGWKHRLKLRS